MTGIEHEPRAAHATALASLDPRRFGFEPFRGGWVMRRTGMPEVAFAALSWPHAQVASSADAGSPFADALGLVVTLQQRTWGMPPEELVPVNVLAILPETGGGVLVAFDPARGWNLDGWLGFAIGFGSRSGVFVSHMLGVREDARGVADIGWRLKTLQAYEAVRTGHQAMIWTFDPMRGANARLNLEKLGAVVTELTIDKYGALRSALYGDVPSDRFTARWELTDPRVGERLLAVHQGVYRGPDGAAVDGLTPVTRRTIPAIRRERSQRLRYRIPGDIDALMRESPAAAIAWRQEMRDLLSCLLTTKRARIPPDAALAPGLAGFSEEPGRYRIDGFSSVAGADGARINHYLLGRLPD